MTDEIPLALAMGMKGGASSGSMPRRCIIYLKKEFKVFCKKWNLVPYCHGVDLYEIASYKTGMDESLLDELKETCYDINTEYTDENGDKFKFTMTNRLQGLYVFSDDVHDKLLEKGFNEGQVDTIIKVLRDLNENN